MPDLIVRSAAESDILDATLWSEGRTQGLGTEFVRTLDVCLAEVRRMPRRFPVVHLGVRRALMRRFPYAVYYVERDDVLVVIACMHVLRAPQRWQDRSRE